MPLGRQWQWRWQWQWQWLLRVVLRSRASAAHYLLILAPLPLTLTRYTCSLSCAAAQLCLCLVLYSHVQIGCTGRGWFCGFKAQDGALFQSIIQPDLIQTRNVASDDSLPSSFTHLLLHRRLRRYSILNTNFKSPSKRRAQPSQG